MENLTGNLQVTRKVKEFGKCAVHAIPARSLRFGPRWWPVTLLVW